MPVRLLPQSAPRDPNFYVDGSCEKTTEPRIEPDDMPCDRDMPAPRATERVPYVLDGGRRR